MLRLEKEDQYSIPQSCAFTCKPCLRMCSQKSSFKLSLQVTKDGLSIKNGVENNTSPWIGSTSLCQIAALPYLLSPTVDRAIALPLHGYDLELQSIISMAIIGRPDNPTQYISPLDDRIMINHTDPIFYTDTLTCCKLDDKTVVTFYNKKSSSYINGQ